MHASVLAERRADDTVVLNACMHAVAVVLVGVVVVETAAVVVVGVVVKKLKLL